MAQRMVAKFGMRTRTVCVCNIWLGFMSKGVTVGKKIKTLKHCVECVCTLLLWLRWLVGRLLPAAKQPHPAGLRVT